MMDTTKADIINACGGDVSDELAVDIYRAIGLPEDAIEWLLDYGDEGDIAYAAEVLAYGYYSSIVFEVITEDELDERLAYEGITEVEYNERLGATIRDAAFDGVLVIGE